MKAEQRRMRVALRWDEVQRQMGERYNGCTFDNFEARSEQQAAVKNAVMDYLREWPENQQAGSGLVLYGPRGSGKTHLASAALAVAARTFDSLVAWTDGLKLFARMRAVIGRDGSEESIIAEFVGADVLLIDDAVPPNPEKAITNYEQSILWRIIDGRYRHRRPTWVTLNVSGEAEAISRLGGQLVDRLIDDALCLKCEWASARTPKRTGPQFIDGMKG